MSFDEQPDGDPHGERAAEIHRLEADLATIRAQNAQLENDCNMLSLDRQALQKRLAGYEDAPGVRYEARVVASGHKGSWFAIYEENYLDALYRLGHECRILIVKPAKEGTKT